MTTVNGTVIKTSPAEKTLTIRALGGDVTISVTDKTHIRRCLDRSVNPKHNQIPFSDIEIGDQATAVVEPGTTDAVLVDLMPTSEQRIGLSVRKLSSPATVGDLRSLGYFQAVERQRQRETFALASSQLDELVSRKMAGNPRLQHADALRLVLTEDARFHPSKRTGAA